MDTNRGQNGFNIPTFGLVSTPTEDKKGCLLGQPFYYKLYFFNDIANKLSSINYQLTTENYIYLFPTQTKRLVTNSELVKLAFPAGFPPVK